MIGTVAGVVSRLRFKDRYLSAVSSCVWGGVLQDSDSTTIVPQCMLVLTDVMDHVRGGIR